MSCGCGCNGMGRCGLSGLGDALQVTLQPDVPTSQPFELSSAQISDLIGRNPYLGEQITNAEQYGYPDLHQGFSFTDSVYGNILISIDANGYLRVVGNSPVAPNTINQPTYVSPSSGGSPTCFTSLEDFWKCFQDAGKWVLIAGAVYLVVVNRK